MGWYANLVDNSVVKSSAAQYKLYGNNGSAGFYIHYNPNMYLVGSIKDNGEYNLTFYKDNTAAFDYELYIYISESDYTTNKTTLFEFKRDENNKVELDGKTVSKTVSGTYGSWSQSAPPQVAQIVVLCEENEAVNGHNCALKSDTETVSITINDNTEDRAFSRHAWTIKRCEVPKVTIDTADMTSDSVRIKTSYTEGANALIGYGGENLTGNYKAYWYRYKGSDSYTNYVQSDSETYTFNNLYDSSSYTFQALVFYRDISMIDYGVDAVPGSYNGHDYFDSESENYPTYALTTKNVTLHSASSSYSASNFKLTLVKTGTTLTAYPTCDDSDENGSFTLTLSPNEGSSYPSGAIKSGGHKTWTELTPGTRYEVSYVYTGNIGSNEQDVIGTTTFKTNVSYGTIDAGAITNCRISEQTNQTLNNVATYWIDSGDKQIVDLKTYFNITGIPNGEHVLHVHLGDYRTPAYSSKTPAYNNPTDTEITIPFTMSNATPATDLTINVDYTTGKTIKVTPSWTENTETGLMAKLKLCTTNDYSASGTVSPLVENDGSYIFSGLSNNTTYYIFAYIENSTSYPAYSSAVSASAKTNSISITQVSATTTSVTIKVSGTSNSSAYSGSVTVWNEANPNSKYVINSNNTYTFNNISGEITVHACLGDSTASFSGINPTDTETSLSVETATPIPASDLAISVDYTTGKTIKVTPSWTANDETGLSATLKICTTNNPAASGTTSSAVSNGSSYTFTGLSLNTTYYIFAYLSGSTNYASYSSSVSASAKTNSITITKVSSTATSVTVKVSGTSNSGAYAGSVTLWNASDASSKYVTTAGSNYTFDNISGAITVYACLGNANNTLSSTNPIDTETSLAVQTDTPIAASDLVINVDYTTGKTIKVSPSWTANDETNLGAVLKICTNNDPTASGTVSPAVGNGGSYTFTGLNQNTNYYIFAYLNGSTSYPTYSSSISASAKTNSISITKVSATTTSVTIKVSGTSGNNTYSGSVTLWSASNPSLKYVTTAGANYTFDNIENSATIYAHLGDYNSTLSGTNPTDTETSLAVQTDEAPVVPASNLSITTNYTTGKTANVTVSWTPNDEADLTASLKICTSNSYSQAGIATATLSNGGSHTFTGLDMGTTYYIFACLPNSTSEFASFTSGVVATARTCSISITEVPSSDISTAIVKVSGMAGNDAYSGSVTIWDSDDPSSKYVTTADTNYTFPITINTTKTIYACLGNANNTLSSTNPIDTTASIEIYKADTRTPAADLSLSLSERTGKTVTVVPTWTANDETSLTATVKICTTRSVSAEAIKEVSNVSSGSTVQFTGLTNGTTYYVFVKLPGSINYDEYSLSCSVTALTFKATMTKVDSTATSITVRVDSNVSGSSSYNNYVTIWTSKDSTKNQANVHTDYTITGLDPGESIVVFACLGIYDNSTSGTNPNDTLISMTIGSIDAASNLAINVTARTGKTVTVRPIWNNNEETNLTATIKISTSDAAEDTAIEEATNIANGGTYTFTGLNKATTYYVFAKLFGSANYIDYSTDIKASTTTYDTIISNPSTTTSSISASLSGNNDYTGAIQWYIADETEAQIVGPSTTNEINASSGILPGKSYTIYAWLNDIGQDTKSSAVVTTLQAASGFSITVTNVTGKTITVKPVWEANGETGATASIKVCTSDNPSSYGIENTDIENGATSLFNKLSNDTTYYIFAKLVNSASFTSYSNDVKTSAKTYATYITEVNVTDTSITAVVTGNNEYTGTYTYWIVDSNTLQPIDNQAISQDGNINVTSGIVAGTDYVIYAYLTTPGDDTVASSAVKTDSPATSLKLTPIARTGKTIDVTPSWTPNDETEVKAIIKICTTDSPSATAIKETTNVANGTQIKFTDLLPDTTYYIFVKLPESRLYSDYTTSAKTSYKTYGTYITNIATTASSISAKISGNNDYSSGYTWWIVENSTGDIVVGPTTISSDGNMVANTGIKSKTAYTIYAYLSDINEDTATSTTTESAEAANSSSAIVVTGRSITLNFQVNLNGSASVTWTPRLFYDGRLLAKGETKTVTTSGISTYVFSNLRNNTEYTVTITATDGTNDLNVDPVTVHTYGTHITLGPITTKSISGVNVHYYNGTGNNKAADVRYYITNDSGTVVVNDTALSCASSNPNSFSTGTVLQPVTRYHVISYINGITYRGENDTEFERVFVTNNPPKDLAATTTSTGTTIGVIPTWEPSRTIGGSVVSSNVVTATIIMKDSSGNTIDTKTTSTSGSTVWFTGLTAGTKYTFVITAVDNENNVLAYASGFTGTFYETTYKLIISVTDVSTRSMRVNVQSNKVLPSGKKIYLGATYNNGNNVIWSLSSKLVNDNSTNTYTSLPQGTEIAITARIQDMYDRTNSYDTTTSTTCKTEILYGAITAFKRFVHRLLINYQAYAGGKEYDEDPISGTKIQISGSIEAKNDTFNISNAENSVIKGYYYNDPAGVYTKTLVFNLLTGGQIYVVKARMSDGYNYSDYVCMMVDTLIQTVYIYKDGEESHKEAIPFVYTNNTWYRAPAYIYSDNQWQDTIPDEEPVYENADTIKW